MAGYDDLPSSVKKEIEADYPEPKKKVEERAPGKEPAKNIPDPRDPKNWMTFEEMDALGIDPNDLTGKWMDHPGWQALPPRSFPVPQVPRDVTGPKTSKVDWTAVLSTA